MVFFVTGKASSLGCMTAMACYYRSMAVSSAEVMWSRTPEAAVASPRGVEDGGLVGTKKEKYT